MFCFGVSGREILLVVAVFCFAWQRRMSLGQGGVESDGGEVPMGEREKREERKARAGVLADYIRIDWTRVNCGCGEHLRLQGAVQLGLTEGRERGVFI